MDTRQLTAFCTVVELKSFSQAAERLGVTQPAVSLQIRSLEERLGQQLLDRSGRRVEPTEAGQRLYRGAQRLLALEQQLVEDVAGDDDGELRGELAIGIVGATPRHRSVAYEPFFRDEVVLVCPPGHAFAGKTITLDDLGDGSLIVMQEGAGVRQVIEDELRKLGTRLKDLDVRLELGLQESVKSAVEAGYGATFISRRAVESELADGTLATARVRGLEPVRQISLVRASGRVGTRLSEAFVAFARERV
jgi:LysR family transcriptional regulator, transcriptional activator of the cysJI operon